MNKIIQLSRLRKKKIKKEPVEFKTNDELTQRFRGWYANSGREKLDESMDRADEAAREMQTAREPDWSIIHQPMTI